MQIEVSAVFIDGQLEPMVVEMFHNVYHDYLARSKKEDKGEYQKVYIIGVEALADGSFGVTRDTTDGIIYINVVDPFLLTDNEVSTFDTMFFCETLAHEMVHAMQAITGTYSDPQVVQIKKMATLAKEDGYFFDKHEVEAYVLDSYYSYMFGESIKRHG